MNTSSIPVSLSTPAGFAAALVRIVPNAVELEPFVLQGLSFLSPLGRARLFRKREVMRLADGTPEIRTMERILGGSILATDEDAVAIIAAGLAAHPDAMFAETRTRLMVELIEAVVAAAPVLIEEVVQDSMNGRYSFDLADLAGDVAAIAA